TPTPGPGTTPSPIFSKDLAMATVYGTLTDLARVPLDDRAVRLRFVPSGPGVAGGRLLSEAPIEVDVQPNGTFSVDVFTTTTISPATYFTVELSYLVHGQASAYERIPGKLRVPKEGGAIGDLLVLPAPPGVTSWGFGPPERDYLAYFDISGERARLYLKGSPA
ncbi:hypothetical protein, partial [Rathayibacter sp. AY1E1]|uniref:hypothetical protein n=1 Tax=Rathayibacter sp. AY1E1 TaxID=2080549 RepID=UPI000D4A519A